MGARAGLSDGCAKLCRAPLRIRQEDRVGARYRPAIAAGQKISATFEPARDPAGKPRPWDIEFGFKGGKLWLFQCRPFLGSDELKNIPALAPLEIPRASSADKQTLSLEEILR